MYLMHNYRHPVAKDRPTPGSILRTLQKSDRSLLTRSMQVTDNVVLESQSMMLGAPLAAGNKLYIDLQQTYVISLTLLYTCMCICVCMCVCACVCMCMCVCACVCMCMCVCVYLCVRVYVCGYWLAGHSDSYSNTYTYMCNYRNM